MRFVTGKILFVIFLLTTLNMSAQNTWTTKASLPEGRSGHVAVKLTNGKILIAGGYDNNTIDVLNSCYLYDPLTNSFSVTGSMTTKRWKAAGVVMPDGKVLVFGGYNHLMVPQSDCELYNPATGTWSTPAGFSMTNGMYNHNAILLPTGNVMVIGTTSGTGSAEIFQYGGTGFNAYSDRTMITKRVGCQSVILANGSILTMGGKDASNNVLNSVEKSTYNPGGSAPYYSNFASVASMLTSRTNFTATTFANGTKVLVVGGRTGADNTTLTNTAEVYDVATNSWSYTTNNLPRNLEQHTALGMPNGKILIVGGQSDFTGSVNSSTGCFIYDPATNSFSNADFLDNPRLGHTTTYLNNGNIMAIGGSVLEGNLLPTELYNCQLPPPPGIKPEAPNGDPNIVIQISNVVAGPNSGPEMVPTGAYAYYEMFTDAGSVSSATSENLAVINGTAGITCTLDNYTLSMFELIQGGDRRVYSGGVGSILKDGAKVLSVTNSVFSVTVNYPVPYGIGDLSIATGFGTIDPANSDAAWIAEFDPHGTGMVRFDFISFSGVIQGNYGYYLINMIVRPLNFNIAALRGLFSGNTSADFSFPSIGTTVDFSSADFSNLNDQSTAALNVMKINGDAGGNNPGGINSMFNGFYYLLGTNVNSFNCNLTFDVSDINLNGGNPQNLRLLKRDTEDDPWEVVSGTSVTENMGTITISAPNVTSFSEWRVGSTDATLLPVELLSFIGRYSSGKVDLTWETATERNNVGFEVERAFENGEYKTVGFTAGNGNSNSVKRYTFTDNKTEKTGNYSYRLKQIDIDGKVTYTKSIEVNVAAPVKFEMEQNYPNPFNPSTSIKINIPESGDVKLSVFNMLGEEVMTLVNGYLEAGSYTYNVNAGKLASGTYIYKLSNGQENIVKKMTLMK